MAVVTTYIFQALPTCYEILTRCTSLWKTIVLLFFQAANASVTRPEKIFKTETDKLLCSLRLNCWLGNRIGQHFKSR